MTDHQLYIARDRSRLQLQRSATAPDTLLLGTADGFAITAISIPAAELLAMIDRAAPDAMRAYLRETAPEVIADLYRPAPAAAEHFDYLDAVPEADCPEDVDERRLCDPLTTGDLADLREAGRTLGEAWREFRDAVRAGADR